MPNVDKRISTSPTSSSSFGQWRPLILDIPTISIPREYIAKRHRDRVSIGVHRRVFLGPLAGTSNHCDPICIAQVIVQKEIQKQAALHIPSASQALYRRHAESPCAATDVEHSSAILAFARARDCCSSTVPPFATWWRGNQCLEARYCTDYPPFQLLVVLHDEEPCAGYRECMAQTGCYISLALAF